MPVLRSSVLTSLRGDACALESLNNFQLLGLKAGSLFIFCAHFCIKMGTLFEICIHIADLICAHLLWAHVEQRVQAFQSV